MRIFGKTALTASLAAVLGLGMTFSGAVVANASTQKAQKTILSAGGSDTIYFLLAGSQQDPAGLDSVFNKSQKTTSVTEIPPLNSAAIGDPVSVTVPADSGCPKTSPWNSDGSYTWDSHDAAHTPPNGSSAGITALQNDDASAHPGCLLDFARASRGLGNPSDTPDLESYAIALDALSWAVEGAAGPNKNVSAPKTLSVSQLVGIYTCGANGAPKFSNWDQVGGKNAPIVKYSPQVGSGTISFFQTKLLGGATVDSGCNSSHLSHYTEENQLSTRCADDDPTCLSGTEPTPTADLPNLITAFSYAQWNAQKAGSEPDLRDGAVLKKVEGIKPTPVTVNEGLDPNAPHFLGTRYVYTVLTQREPNYAAAAGYTGINQLTLTNGFLCQDTNATNRKKIVAVMKKFGFTPLTDQVEGSGEPTGYCRYDATPL